MWVGFICVVLGLGTRHVPSEQKCLHARTLAKHIVRLFIALHSAYKIGTVTLPVSQMGKLRLKEVKMLTPDDQVGKWNGLVQRMSRWMGSGRESE